MMNGPVKKIVIVGGGTAGWMSAALLQKLLGTVINIELVESDAIAKVGVGEATVPPIRHFNSVLGINESDFLRETKATIKLAIKFENWRVQNESYFHSFGTLGKNLAFCPFHHFWTRANQSGLKSSIEEYDLNYLCAKEKKFSPIETKDPALEMLYAYHFDAFLYAGYLRKYSENLGVVRTEGTINQVNVNADSGFVESVTLASGKTISGDFFIDCSGLRALLIQQKLGTGFEDWGHWLPCDRAIAVSSARMPQTAPYTRAIAHSAGWQWQIPLQHRNGSGLVYSSSHYSDDEAAHVLLSNLGSEALSEPNFIQFKGGRRLKQWNKNVVAIGLSSGFIEPLESTSIHLIQSAITRLIKMFPHAGVHIENANEFNRQSRIEFEHIRDFIIMHYHVNQRNDSQFWRNMRNMEIPQSLADKLKLFRASGTIFSAEENLFVDASWIKVMVGQGIIPQDYHPMANAISDEQLQEMLENIKRIKRAPLDKIPTHDEFLERVCRS